jgi:hypothetical protein
MNVKNNLATSIVKPFPTLGSMQEFASLFRLSYAPNPSSPSLVRANSISCPSRPLSYSHTIELSPGTLPVPTLSYRRAMSYSIDFKKPRQGPTMTTSFAAPLISCILSSLMQRNIRNRGDCANSISGLLVEGEACRDIL